MPRQTSSILLLCGIWYFIINKKEKHTHFADFEQIIIKISHYANFEHAVIKMRHFADFEQVKQYYQQNSLGGNRMPKHFFFQYIRMVKPNEYKQRETIKNNGTKDYKNMSEESLLSTYDTINRITENLYRNGLNKIAISH